jgi:hypothetical protein
MVNPFWSQPPAIHRYLTGKWLHTSDTLREIHGNPRRRSEVLIFVRMFVPVLIVSTVTSRITSSRCFVIERVNITRQESFWESGDALS